MSNNILQKQLISYILLIIIIISSISWRINYIFYHTDFGNYDFMIGAIYGVGDATCSWCLIPHLVFLCVCAVQAIILLLYFTYMFVMYLVCFYLSLSIFLNKIFSMYTIMKIHFVFYMLFKFKLESNGDYKMYWN